jgi:hypothetical protein
MVMVMMAMDKRGHIEVTGYEEETPHVKGNLGSSWRRICDWCHDRFIPAGSVPGEEFPIPAEYAQARLAT